MTRITLAVQSKEDQQLLLSLARRLKMKVVRVEEEILSPKAGSIHNALTERFRLNCEKYPEIVSQVKNAKTSFEDTISALPLSALQNLVFSLTDSDSIYFRFPLPDVPESEVHLEVFYAKDDSGDDVEAVLNIYSSGKVVAKKYGSLKNMLETIHLTSSSTACY